MKKKPTRMARNRAPAAGSAFGSSASELLHVSEVGTARNGLPRHRTKLVLEVSRAPAFLRTDQPLTDDPKLIAQCESKGHSDRIWLMREEREKGKLELAEGLSQSGGSEMCDYSLHNVKSRPAKVGDKLSTRDFGTGTRGFAASEDVNVAVCVLPGTELSFCR